MNEAHVKNVPTAEIKMLRLVFEVTEFDGVRTAHIRVSPEVCDMEQARRAKNYLGGNKSKGCKDIKIFTKQWPRIGIVGLF